jgi:hypothetical protein
MPQAWTAPKDEVIDETPVTPGSNVFIPSSGRQAREEQRDQTRTDIAVETFEGAQEDRTLNRFDTYRKEFRADPVVRQFNDVQAATKQIVQLATRTDNEATPGPGDVAMIFSFMKALDPGSVVREGEQATAANAGGIPETVRNYYNSIVKGDKLSTQLQREFANTALSIYNARRGSYDDLAETYRGLVQDAGGDPDRQGIKLSEELSLPGPDISDVPAGGEVPFFEPTQLPAQDNEDFLTSQDQQAQAAANQLWQSGAGLEEWLAFGKQFNRQIPFASQEDLDAARKKYSGPRVQPTGRDPRSDMGIIDSIGETITGSERSTPEVEALPDWTDMPLPDGFEGFKTSAATLSSDPRETAQIILNQVPGSSVRVDDKGNYIIRNGIDGKEYAIKPGFRGSDIPRAVGTLAAFTPAGRAATLPGAFAAGAATQAGLETVQASAGGEFNPEEVAIAGVGNAAGNVIARGIKKALPGGGGGGSSRVIPDAENVITAGRNEGVRVLTSDVAPPKTWAGRWLQQAGEKLPFVGTAGARAEQQQARIAMIERLGEEYGANPAVIDDVTSDFMKTRGAAIEKFAKQKREVFGSMAGAPAPETSASLKALDDAIADIGDQGTFAGLTRQLRTWRADLAKARSIDDVERLRKAVGDVYEDESLKAVSSQLRKVVDGPDGLYASINRDMGDYIKANGGGQAFTKWKAANEELSGLAGDLENATLRRVLSRGEATPEEAAALLFSKKPSDVAALFGNLSVEGKNRARSVIVSKLIDDAGGVDDLSTAKFTTALKKAQKTYGVSFPPEDVARFDGMLRLMQATRRAERAADNLPTGQQLLPFAALSGTGALANFIGGWGATAAVGGTSLVGYKVFESAAMRNLLVALSKTRTGSPGEQNVLRMIGEAAAKASVPATGTAATSKKPQAPEVK